MIAREVLEKCLTEQPAFGFADHNKMQGAMMVEQYLEEAGFKIVKFIQRDRLPFDYSE